MTVFKKCPHCGSTNMKHVHRSSGGFWECMDCGYKGSHTHEEEKETNPEISW
ncbi:hypothetical protein GF345_00230 [Candidatus Woesearchaeota archaeon]|nr:hypothetical protein [Candidatus Woesearchaeota archaeon]